jgi:predicted GNAT family acetyltransferase
VRAVADSIRERGETPFLHTAAENVTAIRLYEALGFRLRRTVTFAGYQFTAQPAPVHDPRRGARSS